MDRKRLCVAERIPEGETPKPKSVSVSFRGSRDDVRRLKRIVEDHPVEGKRMVFADFVREAVEAHIEKLVNGQ